MSFAGSLGFKLGNVSLRVNFSKTNNSKMKFTVSANYKTANISIGASANL